MKALEDTVFCCVPEDVITSAVGPEGVRKVVVDSMADVTPVDADVIWT